MGRGRERLVHCSKCGRAVRKDKAVFIEKVMIQNPVERQDAYDDQWVPRITREVCYCISCGKHLRVFDKKKKMAERAREKKRFGGYRPLDPSTGAHTRRSHGQPRYD
ncbi:40S ribosomal protein S26 [Candidatus Micrarchaeota archaeon]|nr:40S ribosomal protein S26 [Candidatus Micrarchaeota archaeon]